MKKIKWYINTGFATASHKGEWEVEDDVTDEELNDMLRDEVSSNIDAGWYPAEQDDE